MGCLFLLCLSGIFVQILEIMNFTLMDTGYFLYSYRYSWALFLSSLEVVCLFQTLPLSCVRWGQRGSWCGACFLPLGRNSPESSTWEPLNSQGVLLLCEPLEHFSFILLGVSLSRSLKYFHDWLWSVFCWLLKGNPLRASGVLLCGSFWYFALQTSRRGFPGRSLSPLGETACLSRGSSSPGCQLVLSFRIYLFSIPQGSSYSVTWFPVSSKLLICQVFSCLSRCRVNLVHVTPLWMEAEA